MSKATLQELDAEQRVAAGEKFLDTMRRDWRKKIYTGLTMADPEHCLIARIEGTSFEKALASLKLSRDQAIAYGFLRSPNDPVTFYGSLGTCWLRRRQHE